MPQVRREGPVRRQLRGLRRGVRAHRPEEPVFGADRRDAGAEAAASTSSSSCLDPRCVEFLEGWTQDGRLQPEVRTRSRVVRQDDRRRQPKPGDWDISRDAPYFGIQIPDAPGKYFYVWLDAPIGYLASLKNLFAARARRLRRLPGRPGGGADPLHRQGHRHLPHAVLAGDAEVQRPQGARPVFVHGFITVSGEKMSKSRGTGISPLRYLELGMNPEWLRYYIAAKLNARVEDIDFNPDDFVARVNSDLVGKYVNIASRAAGFIAKRFDGQLSADLGVEGACCSTACAAHKARWPSCTRSASSARRCARSCCWPTASTSTSTSTSPGSWPRRPDQAPCCTTCAACASRPSAC
jgi:hypothetical protein